MAEFFNNAWAFVVNVSALVFLLWLIGQVIKGMFRGGK